jgi:transcriptional antiterminator RfaH
MKAWYTVHTKPRQEHLAEEHLQRQGFTVYLPRFQATRRKQDRWQEVIEPLFSRYLFIYTNPETDNLAPIRSTRGVSELVRFGNQLIPLPDALIKAIQGRANPETGLLIPESPLFQTGDRVTILEGPFAQLEGIFQCEQGEQRALILLEVLGSLTNLTISRHNLTRAS